MFDYLIFDIDNTIFNYDLANEISLNYTFNSLSKRENLNINLVTDCYKNIKNIFKNECSNTAQSHNK